MMTTLILGHLIQYGVCEGGFAGDGATNHQDVLPGSDGFFQEVGRIFGVIGIQIPHGRSLIVITKIIVMH